MYITLYTIIFWLYLLHSTGAIPLSNAYYGSGIGPVLIDYVSCIGNERFLTNCTNNGIGVTSSWCGQYNVAGVQCPGIMLKSRSGAVDITITF